MLENTALAQRRIDAARGDTRVKIAASFPDPLYPEDRFNSLIVAPSIYSTEPILSFTVEQLDGEGEFVGRQTGINVEQAKRLIDVLETWIATQQKPRRRCADEG